MALQANHDVLQMLPLCPLRGMHCRDCCRGRWTNDAFTHQRSLSASEMDKQRSGIDSYRRDRDERVVDQSRRT